MRRIALISVLGASFLCFGVERASAQDINSKIKTFCNDKIQLTENSINLSVKQILTLGAARKSSASLDSVSAVEISMMHLNCNLFVAQLITQQQFLDKQTEVLQFAVDLEMLKTLAQASATKNQSNTNTTQKTEAPAAPAGGKDATDTTKTTNSAAGTAGSNGTSPTKGKQPKTGKTATSNSNSAAQPGSKSPTDPGSSVIKSIALELGITLKNNTAVGQSGHRDLVGEGVDRLISTYSPIPVKH
jgi:hypothetical protein